MATPPTWAVQESKLTGMSGQHTACPETLSVGKHTIQAEFTDGTVDAKFTIPASSGVAILKQGILEMLLVAHAVAFLPLQGLN